MHSTPRLPLRAVVLPENLTLGKLYLSSMPGRNGKPIEEFFGASEESRVRHILCLVSDEEIAKKSPDYLTAIQNSGIPISKVQFAIPDYGLPDNPDGLGTVLHGTRKRLDKGESVVIHCAAGRGRTGVVATLLLMEMGLALDHAAELVMEAGSAPDTEEQRQFLKRWKIGKLEN